MASASFGANQVLKVTRNSGPQAGSDLRAADTFGVTRIFPGIKGVNRAMFDRTAGCDFEAAGSGLREPTGHGAGKSCAAPAC